MFFCPERDSGLMYYDELTMSELKSALDERTLVILPFGIIEEHGEHLPLCTDSIQVEWVVEELAERVDALVLPSIRYGLCSSTRNFPGSISLSFDTLRALARDILEELVKNGVKRVMVISGHAGRTHMQALKLAAESVVASHDIKLIVLSPYELLYDEKGRAFLDGLEIPEWDGHAGAIETSRVLAIRPELVKGRGKKSRPRFPRFRVLKDMASFFPSGVMGDPTKASEEKGRAINEWVVNELVELVAEL